ncbi:MAG: hypothetical protein ACL7BU_06920 [Candidatus Phlomobacter fragariae]
MLKTKEEVTNSTEDLILPKSRIIAYYGNLLSKKMGVLGEYPPNEMWRRLKIEASEWEAADSATPVQVALHFVAVVANNDKGRDNKYITRMSDTLIDKVISIAGMEKATIVFLDIQAGLADVKSEVIRLDNYLRMPNIHLGIDPEFTMCNSGIPGKKIGCITHKEINSIINYLSILVERHHIPPKILIIHSFIKQIIDNEKIKKSKNVQLVLNIDGWGNPEQKKSSYRRLTFEKHYFDYDYTGIKLFYKNDLRHSPYRMLSKEEILSLDPKPLYVQYQ